MANILIKIGALLIVFTNLLTPAVKAESENYKQSFYIITEDINSKELYGDLKVLKERKIPVFVVIEPDENINKSVIAVLEMYQRETKLDILLKNNNALEKSYFAGRGYAEKLNLSGLCNIQRDEFLYIGEINISFKTIEITADPIRTMTEINRKKGQDVNYALVISGNSFNISTLLLAYNELQGVPLEISNYSFYIKRPPLIFDFFTHVGSLTIIFFSISIVIFIIAILIFRKWSEEKFLD